MPTRVVVVEWLSSWLAKEVVQGSNPGLATSILETVMPKSVRPKDLTDKNSLRLTKNNISAAAYFIVRTDKIFKISPNIINDWHVKKISTSLRDWASPASLKDCNPQTCLPTPVSLLCRIPRLGEPGR